MTAYKPQNNQTHFFMGILCNIIKKYRSMKFLKLLMIFMLLGFPVKNFLFAQESSFFSIFQYFRQMKISAVAPLGTEAYIITGTVFERDKDILVIVTDINGNYLWSNFVGFYDEITGTFTDDEGVNILNLPAENAFVVLGSTLSGNNTIILKYDINGSLLWKLRLQTGFNTGLNIYTNENNEYFIVGSYAEINDKSFQQPFVLKLDSEGNEIWRKNFKIGDWANSVGQIHNLILNPDGSMIVAGAAKETSTNENTYAFTAHIESNGTVSSSKYYNDVTVGDKKISLLRSGDNLLLITPNGARAFKTSTINTNGSVVSSRTIDLKGLKYPFNFFSFQDTIYSASNPVSDSLGCYLLKIGGQDNDVVKNAFNVSDQFNFSVKNTVLTADSCYLITGEINIEEGGYSQQTFLIKLDKDGRTVLDPQYEYISQATKVKRVKNIDELIIRNVKNSIVVYNGQNNDFYFKIVDFSGRSIKIGIINKNSETIIPTLDVNKGLYLLNIYNSNISSSEKILVE